jgi:hypothetical protein
MLRFVKVFLNEKTTQLQGRLEITADRTPQELAALAYFDLINLFESDGSVKQVKDIEPITRRAIAALEINELFEGVGDQKHAYRLCKTGRSTRVGTWRDSPESRDY